MGYEPLIANRKIIILSLIFYPHLVRYETHCDERAHICFAAKMDPEYILIFPKVIFLSVRRIDKFRLMIPSACTTDSLVSV